MIPTAGELMEKHVICVGAATPLLDVHRLFVGEEINGAPVIDDVHEVVGVITATDLVRAVEEEHESGRSTTDYFRELAPFSSPDWATLAEDFQDRLRQLRAEDVMTRGVICVPPELPAPEVARTLRESRIHRLFVAEKGRVLGVLSAFDLLRLVEDMKDR